MEFFKTRSLQLTERLDPGHYRPTLIENEKKIFRFGSERLKSQYRESGIGHTAAVTPHYTSDPNGVPFISGGCIIGGHLDLEGAERINTGAHFGIMGSSRLEPGFILFVRKGDLGNSAVVPENFELNCSSEVVFLKPAPEVDSYFVSAYLNSRHGRMAFLRQQRGMIITSISLYDVPEIPILKMDCSAKKYIGDKVRQAELLRVWAKELRSSVDVALDQLNLPTAEAPKSVNRVPTERLELRLDPRPYRTHYINLVDRIKLIKHSCVSTVAELASGCPVSSKDFIDGGEVPLVRIRNIGFDEFVDLNTGVTSVLHQDEAKYKAKENMIVLGMDGIFRAQFFLSDELPMLVNQRVAMLTTNDIRAELLSHWLNRPEGQLQLNQWAVKTTVEHTSLSDIGRVLVPRLNRDIEDGLADKLLSARRAYLYSRFLTICAKQLVEALIEGQLTEAELITAEKALQAGNDRLDRYILSRLNTDGIDGEGPARFRELDELYRLLALAEVN